MHWWFSTAGQTTAEPVHPSLEAISEEKLSGSIDDFVAGVVRLLLALMTADGVVERAEYDRVEQIVRSHPRLKGIPPDTLRQTIRQEAARLQTATESAIAELAVLFRDAGERGEAVDIARRFISRRGRRPRSSELAVYRALRSALD
jgi:tellurite resistance protein